MTTFELKKGTNIEAWHEDTRSGFRHIAVLRIDWAEVDRTKATYLNRTWERFEFESVVVKLINETRHLTEQEKKKFLAILKKRGY